MLAALWTAAPDTSVHGTLRGTTGLHVLGDRGHIRIVRGVAADGRPVEVRLWREGDPGTWTPRVRFDQALEAIAHPCLQRRIRSGSSPETRTLWQELEPVGQPLSRVLATHGPPPVPTAIDIGIGVCAALATLHEGGLLHRGINADTVGFADGSPLVELPLGPVARDAEDTVHGDTTTDTRAVAQLLVELTGAAGSGPLGPVLDKATAPGHPWTPRELAEALQDVARTMGATVRSFEPGTPTRPVREPAPGPFVPQPCRLPDAEGVWVPTGDTFSRIGWDTDLVTVLEVLGQHPHRREARWIGIQGTRPFTDPRRPAHLSLAFDAAEAHITSVCVGIPTHDWRATPWVTEELVAAFGPWTTLRTAESQVMEDYDSYEWHLPGLEVVHGLESVYAGPTEAAEERILITRPSPRDP